MSPVSVPRIPWPLLSILGVLLASQVFAQGAPVPVTPAGDPDRLPPAVQAPAPAATVAPAPRAHAMAAEMLAVIEAERGELAKLFARFRAAPDAATALAVQREIEQLKSGTEISLLRIQAGYARRAGRSAQAAELEKVIAELQAPAVRMAPASSRGPEPASR
jgi:hypothetical protein